MLALCAAACTPLRLGRGLVRRQLTKHFPAPLRGIFAVRQNLPRVLAQELLLHMLQAQHLVAAPVLPLPVMAAEVV